MKVIVSKTDIRYKGKIIKEGSEVDLPKNIIDANPELYTIIKDDKSEDNSSHTKDDSSQDAAADQTKSAAKRTRKKSTKKNK